MKAKIYRVQAADGRGPYKPGFSDSWVDPDNDRSTQPGEFPAPLLRKLISLSAQKGFPVAWAFGFRTMRQLNRWFSESELTRLYLHGYRIVEIENAIVIAETENQLLFCLEKPLKEAGKEVSARSTRLSARSNLG